MKKRILSLLFALSLLCGLLPQMGLTAHAETHSGYCGGEGDGSNLQWSFDDATGTLTITGSGEMADYDQTLGSYAPWLYYSHNITTVSLPNGLTSIGKRAFEYCSALTSVTIPDSVTSIGGGAFYHCSSLTSVTIPDSVTSIGSYAFHYCSALTAFVVASDNPNYSSKDGVLFNKSQTKLIQYPAAKSENSYTIPGSVTSIGWYAFHYCSALTSVTIPDSVTSIGWYAFEDCSSLTSVTIGNGVTSIGNNTFRDCSSLTSVTIPDSVTSIGDYAFYGCSGLTSVTIPDSVSSIGQRAFLSCSALIDFFVASDNPNYSSKDGVLFNKSQTELIQYPEAKSENSYTIPDSAASIGNYAFSNCSALTSVMIGNSVTSIGGSAFYNCTALTSVSIPASVTSIGDYAFGYYYYGDWDFDANAWVDYAKVEGFTIYGDPGTAAEEYAEENGFTFVSLLFVNPFVDVKESDFYFNPVLWAVENNVTSGRDATHFAPHETVMRAEAVQFFWAAKGKPAYSTTKSPFKDVKKKHWYYGAVMWAVENKITSGTDETHFSPKQTCSRSEILQFLYAAMGKPGYSIDNPYSDVKTKHWYKDGAIWAYEQGLEKGENGKFKAKTPCTRAYVVTYLYRFITKQELLP